MKSKSFVKIEGIYHRALKVSLEERPLFLAKACGADLELRREIDSLLCHADAQSSLVDVPPFDIAAEMFFDRTLAEIVGKRVGHYKILSHIGVGGMGAVFLAEDLNLGRRVAIKFIKTEFAGEPRQLRRFLREAKTASSLNHPNIITVFEVGKTKRAQFITTEFIDGKTLRQAKTDGLTFNEMLDISMQVATALHAAHTAGVFHRDIKPENIMLREDKVVKVLDFGLAKIAGSTISDSGSQNQKRKDRKQSGKSKPGFANRDQQISFSGQRMGTAAYMSPEQARLGPIDLRTDIWSLGVVMFEMFAGQKPFTGATTGERIASILNDEIALPVENVPDELWRIIASALRKDPDDRYQTAHDLLIDLDHFRKNVGDQTAFAQNSSSPAGRGKLSSNESGSSFSGWRRPYSRRYSEDQTRMNARAKRVFSRFGKNKLRAAGFVFAGLFLLILGGYFYFDASLAAPSNSVAVLPFVNESGNPDLDYLADGLSYRLIDRLSQLPQLKVIARRSSSEYRDRDVDLRKIADALGVQTLVIGWVNQRGDDLEVSVELINASDKTRIWGESYNRKITDIQLILEEIAKNVSRKLRPGLPANQERQVTKRFTDDPEAYQLYLTGVYYRRLGGIENAKKSLDYQTLAMALDPNFALAYAESAIVYTSLIDDGAINPQASAQQARAAAEKALALDETIAEAHLALARIKIYELDWVGAESGFQLAIALSPNMAQAHADYADSLSLFGQHEEALSEIRRAQELDPLWKMLKSKEGSILYFARRYDEALVNLKNSAKLEPGNALAHLFLGTAYTAKKQYREAIGELQLSIKIDGKATPEALVYLGRAYAKSGDRVKARSIIKKLRTTSDYVSPFDLAILYASLSDKEMALSSLEKAYAVRDLKLRFLKVEPGFDDVRDDPRFQDLLRRAGLN